MDRVRGCESGCGGWMRGAAQGGNGGVEYKSHHQKTEAGCKQLASAVKKHLRKNSDFCFSSFPSFPNF